jgi:hypothetical protein
LKVSRGEDFVYNWTMEPLSKVNLLPYAIDEALKGQLPTPYTAYGPNQRFASTLDEMLTAADVIISQAEIWTPPDG